MYGRSLQVEGALVNVDASFLRLHNVPAGRALDLYGRLLGGTHRSAVAPTKRERRHASPLPPSASNMKSVQITCLLFCLVVGCAVYLS